MQFLSIFRKTWWLRMSKKKNKDEIRCLGGFLEEMKAICVEKMHQSWTKYLKIQIFETFTQLLCTFRES